VRIIFPLENDIIIPDDDEEAIRRVKISGVVNHIGKQLGFWFDATSGEVGALSTRRTVRASAPIAPS